MEGREGEKWVSDWEMGRQRGRVKEREGESEGI